MTITYEYGDNLYINVTNRCPNACDFCLRNNSTGSLYADNLWYEGAEPTKEEILADLKKRDLNSYAEIVFCGYGEPACRWDDMLWLAAHLKEMGNYTCASTQTALRTASPGATPRRKCTGFWTLCPSA